MEDQNAVAQVELETFLALGVGEIFRDPHPPAVVPSHGDRVAHFRLGGEQRGTEAIRQLDQFHRLGRSRGLGGFVRLAIVRLRELRHLGGTGEWLAEC